ncbi:hypothetical protein BH18ACI5_BH18ACI5_10320 [soil metagenome]
MVPRRGAAARAEGASSSTACWRELADGKAGLSGRGVPIGLSSFVVNSVTGVRRRLLFDSVFLHVVIQPGSRRSTHNVGAVVREEKGRFILVPHLTAENADTLLAAARHQSKRDIEEMIAALQPKPAVPATVANIELRCRAHNALVAPQSCATCRPRCARAAREAVAPPGRPRYDSGRHARRSAAPVCSRQTATRIPAQGTAGAHRTPSASGAPAPSLDARTPQGASVPRSVASQRPSSSRLPVSVRKVGTGAKDAPKTCQEVSGVARGFSRGLAPGRVRSHTARRPPMARGLSVAPFDCLRAGLRRIRRLRSTPPRAKDAAATRWRVLMAVALTSNCNAAPV